MSVRDARAHLAQLIDRADQGSPTLITRHGQAVAAVVPIEDYEAIEDAIDAQLAAEAEDLRKEGQEHYSTSEVIADLFDDQSGAA